MRLAPALLVALAAVLAGQPATPRFFADDPLAREPESRDASGARAADVGLFYDVVFDLFATSRRDPAGVRARNANTIDEVPDSSWFTNRILARPMPLDELVRGANTGPESNPYILLTTNVEGCNGHANENHEPGGNTDIFPTGGCAD